MVLSEVRRGRNKKPASREQQKMGAKNASVQLTLWVRRHEGIERENAPCYYQSVRNIVVFCVASRSLDATIGQTVAYD
jgi:hypothetical protein